VVAPVSDDGQRRSTGPLPRWVVPIGASAGGIPPSLAAIFYHLPPWVVVAIVTMECIDRDGGRWAISVEAAAQQQTLTPAREVDRRRAAG